MLHLGRVDKAGRLEQIKGVTYELHRFLGQRTIFSYHNHSGESADSGSYCFSDTLEADRTGFESSEDSQTKNKEDVLGGRGDTELYHVTIYLAPGDYHGFHSPASWNAHTRRHFPGMYTEHASSARLKYYLHSTWDDDSHVYCCFFSILGELLTVAPWAVKTMPGLFTLNERVLLFGQWEHGFFSFAAVGAYNVGSISLTVDEVCVGLSVCWQSDGFLFVVHTLTHTPTHTHTHAFTYTHTCTLTHTHTHTHTHTLTHTHRS